MKAHADGRRTGIEAGGEGRAKGLEIVRGLDLIGFGLTRRTRLRGRRARGARREGGGGRPGRDDEGRTHRAQGGLRKLGGKTDPEEEAEKCHHAKTKALRWIRPVDEVEGIIGTVSGFCKPPARKRAAATVQAGSTKWLATPSSSAR